MALVVKSPVEDFACDLERSDRRVGGLFRSLAEVIGNNRPDLSRCYGLLSVRILGRPRRLTWTTGHEHNAAWQPHPDAELGDLIPMAQRKRSHIERQRHNRWANLQWGLVMLVVLFASVAAFVLFDGTNVSHSN